MTLDRRKLLRVLSVPTTGIIAGCSGANPLGPDAEVIEKVQSEKIVLSDDEKDSKFQITLQNTGIDGYIAIRLFWQMEERDIIPHTIDSQTKGYDYVNEKVEYFESDERRTIKFRNSLPDDAVSYHFTTRPITYGAKIRNEGREGDILVEMQYKDVEGLPQTEMKTTHIGKEETKDVVFNIRPQKGTLWGFQVQSEN